MAKLTETHRLVRRRIMDEILSQGTAPTCDELTAELGLSGPELSGIMRDLEAATCIARQDAAHARAAQFQDEPLAQPLPATGEIFYARPFAAFRNHYPIAVNGDQRWYAECAVEACAVSSMFPGAEVIVHSVCRQTGEPVELIGRDGILLDYRPRTLRVHLGVPVRAFASDVLGWCDYNSFFASEDAAREWRRAHPDVKGITRDPPVLARAVTETIGRGRLEYDYQPEVPVLKMLCHMHRYGFTRPTRAGLHVPDTFWMPTPGLVKDWRRRGMKNYVRFTLR